MENDTGDSEPSEITKDWYERRPGPKKQKSITKNDEPVGGPYSLTTSFYGKRGEFSGKSNNAAKINNKGPF